MGKIPADQSIDMRGKTITTYILFHAAKKLDRMATGEVLEISTDKFEAIENDIGSWCRMTGHTLVTSETGDHFQRFYIKKSDAKKTGGKFAIIISDPGLEDLLTPLGLALGAALKGDEVHLIFQGPAVRVLKKGFRGDLKGIWKPFSVFARKGMAKTGHLPPQEKLSQLKELGARIYMCGPSMQHFGVKKQELIYDDVVIGEYMTFIEVMSRADMRFFLQ
ncbi:MAG: DsrE family protein [Nitrospirota bacterium]